MEFLKVEILEIYTLSIGIIARIKFPEGLYPKVGMMIKWENQQFKITGIRMTAPVDSIIVQNMENCIFDCKVELVNQPI